MANSGIKATQAGTSLRAMLTRLSTGSWEAGVAMEKLGIRLDDGHGNMKSLMQVMDELRGSFGDLKMSQADFTAQMNRLDCEKLRRPTMEVIEGFQTQVGKLHQECERLRAENNRLEDENENLRNEVAALSDRVDELSDEIGEPPSDWMQHITPLHKHKQELVLAVEHRQAELEKAKQELRDFTATLRQLMEGTP